MTANPNLRETRSWLKADVSALPGYRAFHFLMWAVVALGIGVVVFDVWSAMA